MLRSIKNKLILFSLCSAVIPIAVITATHYFTTKATLVRHQTAELQAIAELKKIHLETFVNSKKARATDFSSDGLIKRCLEKIMHGDTGKKAVLNVLKRHLVMSKKPVDSQLVAVAVLDITGVVVASTDETIVGKAIFGETFKGFIDKACADARIAVLPSDASLHTEQIFICAPIYSKSGALEGGIVNIYKIDILKKVITNRIGVGESGEILLGRRINNKAAILVSSSQLFKESSAPPIPFDSPRAQPMKQALLGGNGTVICSDYRGIEALAVYYYLPFLDLGLVVKMDTAEVFWPMRRLGIIALAVGGICVATVGVAGFMFALSIARPIKNLTVAAEKFADGDLTYRTTMTRKDELGTLAVGFNDMIDKLARSNQELENFAYVASHDLQEPLRKIVSFGDRLHSLYANVITEQGADYLQRMQNAARRMQQLIEDLLMYSRITTKTRPFAPVNIGSLIKDVLTDLETQIARTGGSVSIEDLPTLDADAVQMRQLFQNLIGNALKFHKKDAPPAIVIKSRRIDDGYCEITVEDNGIGFDEKYLDRIFIPFERLHGRNEYEGTGIGLAVCQKVVKWHGGRITAKSAAGKGTVFVVQLPFNQRKRDDCV